MVYPNFRAKTLPFTNRSLQISSTPKTASVFHRKIGEAMRTRSTLTPFSYPKEIRQALLHVATTEVAALCKANQFSTPHRI